MDVAGWHKTYGDHQARISMSGSIDAIKNMSDEDREQHPDLTYPLAVLEIIQDFQKHPTLRVSEQMLTSLDQAVQAYFLSPLQRAEQGTPLDVTTIVGNIPAILGITRGWPPTEDLANKSLSTQLKAISARITNLTDQLAATIEQAKQELSNHATQVDHRVTERDWAVETSFGELQQEVATTQQSLETVASEASTIQT